MHKIQTYIHARRAPIYIQQFILWIDSLSLSLSAYIKFIGCASFFLRLCYLFAFRKRLEKYIHILWSTTLTMRNNQWWGQASILLIQNHEIELSEWTLKSSGEHEYSDAKDLQRNLNYYHLQWDHVTRGFFSFFLPDSLHFSMINRNIHKHSRFFSFSLSFAKRTFYVLFLLLCPTLFISTNSVVGVDWTII